MWLRALVLPAPYREACPATRGAADRLVERAKARAGRPLTGDLAHRVRPAQPGREHACNAEITANDLPPDHPTVQEDTR